MPAADRTEPRSNENFGGLGDFRVIILNDEEFDRVRLERIARSIHEGVTITSCDSLMSFASALDADRYDVALVDHRLRDETGLEASDMIQNHPLNAGMAVIMVAGTAPTAVIVEAMKNGFSDYIGKDELSVDRLRQSILDSLIDTLPAQGDLAPADLLHMADRIVHGLASGCVKEMKPRIQRIYRNVGFIRTCHSRGYMPSPDVFDDIEDHCLRIWRFLDEVMTYGSQFRPAGDEAASVSEARESRTGSTPGDILH